MSRRRTLGLAAATSLVVALGAYGASTALAAGTIPTHQPTPSTSTAPTASSSRDAMIGQCVHAMPTDDRASAQQDMQQMMNTGPDSSTNSMMDGGSGS